MSITIELQCPKHPRYMAKRVPRVDCRGCWRLYFFKAPEVDGLKVKRIELPDDCPNCGGSAPA